MKLTENVAKFAREFSKDVTKIERPIIEKMTIIKSVKIARLKISIIVCTAHKMILYLQTSIENVLQIAIYFIYILVTYSGRNRKFAARTMRSIANASRMFGESRHVCTELKSTINAIVVPVVMTNSPKFSPRTRYCARDPADVVCAIRSYRKKMCHQQSTLKE